MRTPSTFDLCVLLRKLEHAASLNELRLYAEEAKTAPEADKPILREAYVKRVRELKGTTK